MDTFGTLLYDWGGLNRQLFAAINGIRGPWVDAVMLAGTHLGDLWNAVWFVTAMSLLIAGRRLLPQAAARRLPNEHAVVDVLLAFVIAGAIALLLVYAAKTGFDMPRPYSALPAGSVNLLVELREPYSLPSGHAAFAMLVACVLWPASPGRWKAALVLAVVWVGVSRVNVGAHFPADVVAGIICGGGSAWLGGKVRKLAASSMKSG